ncbi:MAG: dTMP kinase [Candidatus Margulisbacteria bacterium]|jgi:dTMP kinase|nr:dTMP kinase [Candidatus Margulisiibacteriota bacterium]
MKEAVFITFEGPDGSGKTTQSKMLYEELLRQGRPAIWTREPGGTKSGRKIRSMLLDDPGVELSPETELFLFAADRAQHIAEIIRPALDAGKIVICDRYMDSTTAYQSGGRGFPVEMIVALNEYSTGGLRPDLTFLLDVPSGIGLKRAAGRKTDKFEQESLVFHQRVRQKYLDLAQSDSRIVVLDGSAPIKTIFQVILTYLQNNCSIINK